MRSALLKFLGAASWGSLWRWASHWTDEKLCNTPNQLIKSPPSVPPHWNYFKPFIQSSTEKTALPQAIVTMHKAQFASSFFPLGLVIRYSFCSRRVALSPFFFIPAQNLVLFCLAGIVSYGWVILRWLYNIRSKVNLWTSLATLLGAPW